jgi:hypothetical protein
MTNFIPIFPLNVVLYPGETLNLHIFEPRYKELVKECFGNTKPFGIPAVINGHVAEFAPPLEWVGRLVAQARECGCRIYCKPNLLGVTNPQSPGMQLPQEEPLTKTKKAEAA